MRPNDRAGGSEDVAAVPRPAASRRVLRCRARPALTIARIYKCRWQVEVFFKWIKQHLRIKAFYGTSDNAVKIQVWIAISVYVLVAIIKKELGVERSLSEILQILSLTLFEKTPIFQALSESKSQDPEPPFHNQLNLFDL